MNRSVALRGIDSLALVALLALALIPLAGTFGGSTMWPAVTVGLLAGGAIAAATARYAVPVTMAGVVAGYFLLGGVLTLGQTTWFGLPTPTTLRRLAIGAVAGWKQILMITPPLGGSGGVLIMPFLLALAAGALVVSVVWRAGGWAPLAALVPVAVLVAAILFGPQGATAPVAVGLAVTLGLLTWTSWRIGLLRARPVAAVMVAAMVVAGIGGAALVPDRVVLRDQVTPPFDPRDYPSPLSAYRAYLKNQRETPLVTVRGLPSGAAVRLAIMDDFDGVVWNVSQGSGSGMFARPGARIQTPTASGRVYRVDFEVRDLSGVWLPTVGEASSLTMDETDAENLRYNTASSAAVLMGGVRGATYAENCVLPPTPDDAQLGDAEAASVHQPEPRHVPDVVATRASEFVGALSSAPEKARALEQALIDRGWFSNGLEGDYPSLSGHGADRIAALLGGSTMVGDSEQYASAMALMARQAGLPARVVLGFVPNAEEAGNKTITMTGDDVQAWVEIAIEGHGWIAYYPTPPETKIPQQDEQVTPPDPQPKVLQPPPPPPEPVTNTSRDDDASTTGERQDVVHSRNWLPIVAASVPVLVLTLIVAGIGAIKALRRYRRRRTGSAADRVAAGWDELLDVAADLRIRPSPMGTRIEHAAELEPVAGGGIVVLATQADRAAFGPSEDADAEGYWRQISAVLGALRAGRTWWQRVRARLSLASMLHRRRRRTRRKP